jgi:alpha-ribazole phosphatase
LLLVRHGQTSWNLQSRFQGNSDIPLDETGQRQALALGSRLSEEPIDVIFASDLKRSWDTAKIISERNKTPLIPEPRLREVNFGEWEGLTYDEIKTNYPQALESWEKDMLHAAAPGGENLEQLASRVNDTFERIMSEHASEDVLVVAHGGSLQILLCLLLGLSPLDYWKFYFSRASLSIIHLYDEGPVINLLNDTCHLGDAV